jgi:hypothetical protein
MKTEEQQPNKTTVILLTENQVEKLITGLIKPLRP